MRGCDHTFLPFWPHAREAFISNSLACAVVSTRQTSTKIIRCSIFMGVPYLHMGLSSELYFWNTRVSLKNQHEKEAFDKLNYLVVFLMKQSDLQFHQCKHNQRWLAWYANRVGPPYLIFYCTLCFSQVLSLFAHLWLTSVCKMLPFCKRAHTKI